MTTCKLNFATVIPIEVFTETGPASLIIKLNDRPVYEKQFAGNITHNEIIKFTEEYTDGDFNMLSFQFAGPPLTANKYLRINSIAVNNQKLNVLNSEYFPEIDKEWWEVLSTDEKQKYEDIIYGKAGNTFGWWGEVNFYYCTGVNFKSKMRYHLNDNRILLHEQVNWIFLDKDSIKDYNKTV